MDQASQAPDAGATQAPGANPSEVHSRLAEAVALHQQGRLEQAAARYEEILRRWPEQAAALHLLGVIASQTGVAQRAVSLITRAIALEPGQALYHFNLGNALGELGQPEPALAAYARALELDPGCLPALHNRGLALLDLGRPEAALAEFDRALARQPELPETWFERGNALQELGRTEPALASYDRVLALQPRHLGAQHNRACALLARQDWAGALAGFDHVLALQPDHGLAWGNRGVALEHLGRGEEALASQDRAIALEPEVAEHHCNRGNALAALGRREAALPCYDRAIGLRPDLVTAHRNQGGILQELDRQKAALACFERALALAPLDPGTLLARGNAHALLDQPEAAREDYDRAMVLDPELPFLPGIRLANRMQLCLWDGLETELAALLEGVARGARAALPFSFLGLSDDPRAQAQVAATWARAQGSPEPALGPIPHRPRPERIRLGYLANTFHNHPMAHLMAECFERHDRERFELIAFSYGPACDDPIRARLEAAFDRFIDVRGHSDREVAALSRELRIDVAIDRNGYTSGSRNLIFSHRAAPIQVSYLAYPGTLAMDAIDYLIADATVVTEAARPFFTEKLVYLPETYQANSRRPVSDRACTRGELGLPPHGFVFCCFNNTYKITPTTFDGWMRILARVPASVLWLLAPHPAAMANLRREAAARGIDPARLVFAPRMPLPEHLARQRQADLFLDTLPYNAHTTASDALWVGLPVLTRPGASFQARVAASLLKAIRLPELIAGDAPAFEDLAVELATRPERLGEIRARLEANRLDTPLFDTALCTRNLERAYLAMLDRHYAGLPPDDIRLT